MFGEIVQSARSHLAAASLLSRARLPGAAVTAATHEAGQIARAMSRYLDDVIPYGPYETAVLRNMEPSMQALADAREALHLTAAGLRSETEDSGRAQSSGEASADSLAAHLAGAATAMAAGRDMLRTHFTIGADGLPAGHSDWSAVITSPPVTRALLEEIARWSHQLALLGARLTPAAAEDPDIRPSVRHGLAAACQWLLTASSAITASQHDTNTAPDAALLRSIPSGAVPERRLPGEAEPVSELCDGAVISAVRLRAISRQTIGEGTWSETATAASWRWTAKAAAVICHLSELMLTEAAQRVSFHRGQPDVGAQLHAGAAAFDQACARWREVAAAWKEITTETRGLAAPRIADTSDLVVRLGRLATGDPTWTPSRAPRVQLRNPADLLHSRARVAGVMAAVHHAADALACAAAADRQEVNGAARAGRLYVPTRSMPEKYDGPFPFGPATSAQVELVLDAYQTAAAASAQSARALDSVAISLNTPSRMLAVARAATASAEGRTPRSADSVTNPVGTVPDLRDSRGPRQPGPVEQAVRGLAVGDEILVLRASAIDKAARHLIAEAEESASARIPSRAVGTPRPASPAQAAAESFPQQPVTTTASGEGHGDLNPAGPRIQNRQGAQRSRSAR